MTASRLLGLALLGLTAVTSAGLARQPAPRPNIVFIMTDDHADQAISAYGWRVNRTPHLDRLAAEGARP